MKHRFATLALLLAACAPDTGAQRERVVYGTDDRTEVYAHPSAPLRDVASRAVAVQIDEGWIDESNPADVRITYTRTLGEAKSLCAGQRFADQIEPGTCSGTLVDDRHILTAGHCMETADDCASYVWVLGFRYASAGTLAPLTSDDVYRCQAVVAHVDDGVVDHAFVRLDRPVVGHVPATVRVDPAGLAEGTSVALIGHPNGIPMKIDSGGVVTTSSPGTGALTATVDAFAGNSGSGVFDTSGRMVAILRAGETDYVDEGGCNVVNVIDPPPTDDGESLVDVGRAIDAFCATDVVSPLCDCPPHCIADLPGDRCADAVPIEAVTQTIEATLTDYAALTTGSCGGDGPERSYAFTLGARTHVVAHASGFDAVLYVRDGCDGSERACNDDVSNADRSALVDVVLEPGSYVLFVDAYDTDAGDFTLDLTFEALGGDAGVSRDAGTPSDAGTSRDAGASTIASGACGCRAATSRPTPLALLVAVTVLIACRRRRRSNAPLRVLNRHSRSNQGQRRS